MSLVGFRNEESNFPTQLFFSSSAIANFISANAEVVLKNFVIKSVTVTEKRTYANKGCNLVNPI